MVGGESLVLIKLRQGGPCRIHLGVEIGKDGFNHRAGKRFRIGIGRQAEPQHRQKIQTFSGPNPVASLQGEFDSAQKLRSSQREQFRAIQVVVCTQPVDHWLKSLGKRNRIGIS